MTQYFEYTDDKTSKFWEITLNGNNVTTRYGKTGTVGKETVKSFDDEAAAQKEYNKLVKEKTKKGYIEAQTEKTEKTAEHQAKPVNKPDKKKTAKQEQTSALSSGGFRFMMIEDLYENYRDKIKSSEFKRVFDKDEYKENGLLFCEGDAVINSHLYLANLTIKQLSEVLNIEKVQEFDEELLNYQPSAIVVLGNLEINGSLLNLDEYLPFLYVGGNLKAKNVTAGNSCIFISGNADIEEVLHGYYNDGMLEIDGTTKTGLFFQDDHYMGLSKLKVNYKSFKKATKDKLIVKDIEEDEVLEYLYEGKYIFTASAEPEVQDEKYWLRQVKKNGKRLKKVPADFMNEDIILAAVAKDAEAYNFIPTQFLTEDLLIKAVSLNGYVIKYIPKELITRSVAENAIRKTGYLLEQVPFKVIDKELCYTAIEGRTTIAAIPLCYLDEDMICEIIRNRPDEIKKILAKFYTLKVLVQAAKLGNLPLPYGKRLFEYYDEERAIGIDNIGLEAIKESVEVLDILPGFIITKTVYDEAEKLYGKGETKARWEEIKTRHGFEFYKYYFESHLKEIESSPDHEMRYGHADNDYEDMDFTFYLWNVFWTKEYVAKAIKVIFRGKNESNLPVYIPAQFFTPEEGMLIVKSSYNNFKRLPATAMDERVCQFVVVNSQYFLKYIPDELFTEELCLLGISKNIETEFGNSIGSGFSLGDIPYQFRTERVCREALASDKRAKSAIPEKYKYIIE